jgi:hypothetical protein
MRPPSGGLCFWGAVKIRRQGIDLMARKTTARPACGDGLRKGASLPLRCAGDFLASDANRIDLNAFDQTMIGVQFKQPK